MTVDPETFTWVWLKIFLRPYPNKTFGFASPAGLWEVVVRVLVECNCFLAWIYYFNWYEISYKSFTQAYFCLFLTCLYFNYWISVHWSWNLSSVVIANCLWAVSKTDIRISSPCRIVEGRGEGAGFLVTLVIIDWLVVFK